MRICVSKPFLNSILHIPPVYCRRNYIISCRCLKFKSLFCTKVTKLKPSHVTKFYDVGVCIRQFSLSAKYFGDNLPTKPEKITLKLMDIPPIIYPIPWRSLKNRLYEFLIKYNYGASFSIPGVVDGATQALIQVSFCLSKGYFSEVEELIEPKALREIKDSYSRLDEFQRNFIAVSQQDLFRKFLFDLKIKEDKKLGKEFAEATVVFHGYHGYTTVDFTGINPLKDMQDNPDEMFICNYKLVKELTKDLEKDWIIRELNHFQAIEYM